MFKRELIVRDKTSFDITGLKEIFLADLNNLSDLDVLTEEITEYLESALRSIREVIGLLKK